MKRQKISECIGGIDEKYIDEANTFTYAGRRMGWKKWTAIAACLAVVVIAIILLDVVNTQSRGYTLRHEGNYTYLQFSEKMQESLQAGDIGASVVEPSVWFDSLSEMKRKIMDADFTESELWQLNRLDKNEAGEIILPNMNQLFEPVLPNGVTTEGVWLRSYGYAIPLCTDDPNDTWDITFFSDNEDLNRLFDLRCADAESGVRKQYEIKLENGKVYVFECISTIILPGDQPGEIWTDAFFFTDNGNFLLANIDPSSAVTEEFLTQFGCRLFAQ